MVKRFDVHWKVVVIVILVAAISISHYLTQQSQVYEHIFFRELYFLPLILAAFWFGLKGGLVTALSITAIYVPFSVIHWNQFSPDDLNRIFELALYNTVAVVMGMLRDRDRKSQREKLEGILAMAGSVAHELNTPLYVVLANVQLIQSEFESDSQLYNQLQEIIDGLKKMSQLIKKIASIDKPQFTQYVGDSQIVDIEKSMKRT
jgi:two-component system sensor histidine kinase HydH